MHRNSHMEFFLLTSMTMKVAFVAALLMFYVWMVTICCLFYAVPALVNVAHGFDNFLCVCVLFLFFSLGHFAANSETS